MLQSQRADLLPLLPIPLFLSASGTYQWSQTLSLPPVTPLPIPKVPPIIRTNPIAQVAADDASMAEAVQEVQATDAHERAAAIGIVTLSERLCLDIDGRWQPSEPIGLRALRDSPTEASKARSGTPTAT